MFLISSGYSFNAVFGKFRALNMNAPPVCNSVDKSKKNFYFILVNYELVYSRFNFVEVNGKIIEVSVKLKAIISLVSRKNVLLFSI